MKEIQSIEDWDQSYFKRLTLFLSLSAALHAALFGSVLVLGMFMTGGRGLDVLKFDPGQAVDGNPSQPAFGDFDALERIKIFRVDFFSEIIPWTPPPPEPDIEEPVIVPPVEEIIPEEPEIVEEIEEEIIEEPVVESVVETEPVLIDTDTEPDDLLDSTIPEPDEEIISEFTPTFNLPEPMLAQPDYDGIDFGDEGVQDAFGTFGGRSSPESESSNVFPIPEWKMIDMDGYEWQSEYFLDNYTIYIIGDITTRHGLDDMLAWNYVIRQLMTNPQAAYPPNIVTVATGLEGYYRYDEADIKRILKAEHEDENTLGVQIADPDGEFPMSLGYTKLPQPVVIFADNFGYIRLIMIGRIRDISNQNILATMDVISEMWQWDESEEQYLPTVVTLLINMLRDTAYDEVTRQIPPETSAYTIAPTWGYPDNFQDFIRRPSPSDDPDYSYAPF